MEVVRFEMILRRFFSQSRSFLLETSCFSHSFLPARVCVTVENSDDADRLCLALRAVQRGGFNLKMSRNLIMLIDNILSATFNSVCSV